MAARSQRQWFPCWVIAGLTLAPQGSGPSCCLHMVNLGSAACWAHRQAPKASMINQFLHPHMQTFCMLCGTGPVACSPAWLSL